jgi:hypothetical protein
VKDSNRTVPIIFDGVTLETRRRITQEARRRQISEDQVVQDLLDHLPAPSGNKIILGEPLLKILGEPLLKSESLLNGKILNELAMAHLPPTEFENKEVPEES